MCVRACVCVCVRVCVCARVCVCTVKDVVFRASEAVLCAVMGCLWHIS